MQQMFDQKRIFRIKIIDMIFSYFTNDTRSNFSALRMCCLTVFSEI